MHVKKQESLENSALQFLRTPSKQLVVQSSCIPYLPELAEKVGRSAAVFLQQLHYWTKREMGKCLEGKKWIYNTYEEWAEQLKFSPATIRGVVRKLKSMGLIHTQRLNGQKGDQTLWYTLNYDVLKELGLPPFEEERKSPSFHQPCNDNRFEAIPLADADNRLVLKTSVSLTETNKFINKLSLAKAESDLNEMIKIWNQFVHRGKKTIQLTKANLFKLKRRLERMFKGSLEKWQEYCALIADNDFLMGGGKRGWKATLHWALDEENIKKVLSGFYIKRRFTAKTESVISPEQERVEAKKTELYALKDRKSLLENTIEHIKGEIERERRRGANKAYETLSAEEWERYKHMFEEQNKAKDDPRFWNAMTRSIFEMFLRSKLGEETFKDSIDTHLETLPRVKGLRKEIEEINNSLQALKADIRALEEERDIKMNKTQDGKISTHHLSQKLRSAHKKLTETLEVSQSLAFGRAIGHSRLSERKENA